MKRTMSIDAISAAMSSAKSSNDDFVAVNVVVPVCDARTDGEVDVVADNVETATLFRLSSSPRRFLTVFIWASPRCSAVFSSISICLTAWHPLSSSAIIAFTFTVLMYPDLSIVSVVFRLPSCKASKILCVFSIVTL